MPRPKIYKEGRTSISITVDPTNIERARALKINISRVCDMAIANAINEPTPDIVHRETKNPYEIIKAALPLRTQEAIKLVMEKSGITLNKAKNVIIDGHMRFWDNYKENGEYWLKSVEGEEDGLSKD